LTAGARKYYRSGVVIDKDYIFYQKDRSLGGAAVAPSDALAQEPEVRPTPLAALALSNMPTELHFVRSHFGVPAVDAANWRLKIDGAVEHPRPYSLAQVQQRPARTQAVVLECAGHRRNEFQPRAAGLQWGVGAVSEARWTGISLSDVLLEASPTARACEVLFEAADRGGHRSADHDIPFARSIPLDRALAGDVLLAWEMNGYPIPSKHGAPLRVIVPGSYGVASVKWVHRITVLEREFVGPFQTDDYLLNAQPLQELRVNSLIVEPADGATVQAGTVEVSGVAWTGRNGLVGVDVRVAGGPWCRAKLLRPEQPTSLNRWRATLRLPPGKHRLEVRARDRAGASQPEQAEWNPLGYANNGIHGIRIRSIATAA
jgi:DMSO/TMAO reductase YedYZ molybdopterin-dependent catalytic subunit